MAHNIIKIGLTGGIGSGKSTAAKYFNKLGIPIIDADEISHELTKLNSPIYKKIIKHFGEKILSKDNQIDRKKLKQLIFSDKNQRLWLENLIHPCVRKHINKYIKLLKTCDISLNILSSKNNTKQTSTKISYCIIVIPLLFETKFPPKIDRILAIDCPKNIQIQRIRKRNKCSISQAKTIIDSQINRKDRLFKANDIIYNTKSLLELKEMVKRMHKHYLNLF